MNIAVGDIDVNVSISFVVAHYVKIVALNVGFLDSVAVAYLGGGGLCEAPFGRTAVIFVTILGLFLAPF